MADKKEESGTRTTPTQGGSVLGRTIAHDGIGVGVPGFIGWVADWGVGLLRSGAHLLTGKLERPDIYANGPADRSMGGLAAAEGSIIVGQNLSELIGVGNIRTKAGAKDSTGSLNVNVSFDSGKSWDKASLGEGAAHWGGQVVDPTLLLPLVAAAKKAQTLGKVASATDKALGVAGLGTLGLAVGHDGILRGMILNPNEALDVLDMLNKPKGLESKEDIRKFHQNMNFMLKEFHDPINDKNRTTFGMKNKNADPDAVYIRSLDPTSGTFETTKGASPVLKDNYVTAALEINKVIADARLRIEEGKGTSTVKDHKVVEAGLQFDKRFNEISLRYLQQGDKMNLSDTDKMAVHFRMGMTTLMPYSPDNAKTLTELKTYLQKTYQDWSETPAGKEALKVGVQSGVIKPATADSPVPTGNLNFMLQAQNSQLSKDLSTNATGLDAAQRKSNETAPTFDNAMGTHMTFGP